MDNSASVIIWNCLSDFVNYKPYTNEDISESVRTIGEGVPPLGYGDVPFVLKDNENVEHQLFLIHVYYFPYSEVNIMSISELATLFPNEKNRPDEEGTHIKSHRSKSTLT